MKAFPLKLSNPFYIRNKMKKLLISLCLVVFWSCNQKAETPEPQLKESKSVAPKPVGSDEDSQGCKTSAGYTWSELRQECIRIFEVGTRFDPVDANGMSAFVVMDASEKQAELFTLLEKKPLILTQISKGKYATGDWELHMVPKPALLYQGKIVFTKP
jgi:hypothetical protein